MACFLLFEYINLKKVSKMTELLKLSLCIFGAIFLFTGLVSLINTMPDLFFLSLPINLIFIFWFHNQLIKKY